MAFVIRRLITSHHIDLAIRIVGNTSENQARVQRLHTRIAAIPIFSSSVNQLRDYWVEQYTYYVYLSEAWGVAGNRNHKDKVSAGWIVYSLASTSIEQVSLRSVKRNRICILTHQFRSTPPS